VGVEYDTRVMERTIEAYAQVMAELASAGEARAPVLARHGLDESSWAAVDDHWQAELSAALDPEDDGVPEILSAYAAAYEAAQRALAPPISIEQLAQVTRLIGASGDVRAALAKVGVTLADYVRGTEHWSRQLVADPELERRFNDVVLHGQA
jgi:hypothetical protein